MKQLLSSFEGKIVNYYDLFFLGNIEQQFSYIKELFSEMDCKFLEKKYDICIDAGCGTGAYTQRFSEYFDKVVAVDISQDMINYAQRYHLADNIDYVCENICKFETNSKGDLAVALSHVIGYQLENDAVEKMLRNINGALKKNGIFLFNFYNEPALFQGKLKSRFKKVENNFSIVSRFSNATICASENALLLDYYYIVETPGNVPNIFEIHEKMRYFTVKEMEYYLQKTGFEIIKVFHYGTRKELLSEDWNAGMIVRKVRNV